MNIKYPLIILLLMICCTLNLNTTTLNLINNTNQKNENIAITWDTDRSGAQDFKTFANNPLTIDDNRRFGPYFYISISGGGNPSWVGTRTEVSIPTKGSYEVTLNMNVKDQPRSGLNVKLKKISDQG